jgi:bacillolysin
MFLYRRLLQITSIIVILTMILSGFPMQSASAQGKDGIKRQVNIQTGKVSFIGSENGSALSASKVLEISPPNRLQNPAMALAKRFGPEFGLKNPERDLAELKTNHSNNGRLSVHYQQNYQGVPVMGGELIVNTNENGDLYSINGEVSSDLSLRTQPTIDAEQAKQTALQAVAKWYQKAPEDFLASEPKLWIYDESLLRSSSRPVELVWRMEVTPKDIGLPVRELVLVDALRGNISLHFNQIDTAWHSYSNIRSLNHPLNSNKPSINPTAYENPLHLIPSSLVNTYTANGGSTLPGTFLCNQSDPNCAAGDSHAKAAHKYAIGTYNLYATQYGRNSIDNHGMTIVSSVHYCEGFLCPYPNAFWSGTQMVYGDAYGFPLADDVVAHELTHGVTQYESNLFYYYQSGAINESFSDLWGEYYDQTNSLGTDTAGVKWQIGEDISGLGTIRDMSNPPAFGDPDKMSSANYFKDEDDNGGVHHNSGVNSKAVFLMVDGGTFNGKTVSALGWTKTAAIYYEVNTNLLSSGADYSDLYYALQQACSNLIGQKGITAGDCTEVKDAIDAVEMNGQPAPNFNTDAPLCTVAGTVPNFTFADDLETGTANWTFTNGAYPRWQIDSPDGPYAQSGSHSLYANDKPDVITDTNARLKSFVVPSNAYLHFSQAYGFESGFNFFDLTFADYDGGVLEYSINNGSSWVDAGSLIDFNGYHGTIFTGAGNPLSGRSAFVGSSHGYISTRLNLASLAGQNVTFRWRMGLDEAVSDWGWWVDNVKVYTCGVPAVLSADTTGVFRPSNGALYLKNSNTTGLADVTINYGLPGDYPVVGDWDGDGDATIGVYRNGVFYLRNSNTIGFADIVFPFGAPGDQPIAGDWNGDGVDTIGVYRNGTFFLRNSNSAGTPQLSFALGNAGDVGIAGDWNGDGMDSTGVFRPSNGALYLKNTNATGFADIQINYGLPGDRPVTGDWNNDGVDTIGIYRNGTFYLRNSNTIGFADLVFALGINGDMPIAGNWDGLP